MKILIDKTALMLLLLLLFSIGNVGSLFAEDSMITVYSGKEIGRINKNVFGNNFIGYDPTTYENRTKPYYGYSDYGAGIWDPKWNEPVQEVIGLAKEAGITILRFPGGCGTHRYNWKDAVGKEREHFLYGIDEFLKTVEEIGAEAIITVSYFTGNEKDAADLIEYLNFPNDGSNPNGGKDWAAERAKNGHPKPYNVKYFEIGNEVWHGDHRDIKKVAPGEYAERYLKYYRAMKIVDPAIEIGVVLHTQDWNKKILEIIKGKLDFGIIHTYPSPRVSKDKLAKMDAKDIFRISLSVPVLKDEYRFRDALKLLKENSGRNIPLAITEYNGGFVQDKPVPYRHSLGTALLNAELLRIFMKPENDILMANYWQFNNSYWGMFANGFNGKYETLNKPYYKRPNYYVYEMHNDYFGDILIEADVQSVSYNVSEYPEFFRTLVNGIKKGKVAGDNLIEGKWKISNFPGVFAIEKGGVLSLEFKAPEKFNYYHVVMRVVVEPNTYYRLSGYIKADDLIDKEKNGVCLEVQDGRGWTKTHSAMSTQKIKGTTNWQYVETIYKTLPDAKSVNIIARRAGETGPLKGKAYFRDVKLEKFIPDINTKIPCLSVNASKSEDGKKIYLMVINKNLEEPMTTTIELKDFVPEQKGNAWVLNGPSVDATNEKKHSNVKITHKEFEIWNKEEDSKTSFEFTFEPHSLTAIEIGMGWGRGQL